MKKTILIVLLVIGILFTFLNLSQGWCPAESSNSSSDSDGDPHQDIDSVPLDQVKDINPCTEIIVVPFSSGYWIFCFSSR